MATLTRIALLVLAAALAGSAGGAAPPSSLDKVGSPVRQALLAEEWVRVFVFLDAPAADSRQPLEDVRLAVREAQDRALQEVPPEQLRMQRRMATIPAFAALVSREGLDRLASAPGVVRVDLDRGGSGTLAEAVPLTHTDAVHALGYTGQGVTVAVLDTGIDTDHPDLADDLVAEACFCSDNGAGCCPGGGSTQVGPGAAEDDNGHGTHTSGIITSGGTIAPLGTAPDAGIVAVKVMDENNRFCCNSDVLAGLDWIRDNRPDVDVVSMSLGTDAMFAGNCDAVTSENLAYASLINGLRARGVLSFVSSGNESSLTQMRAPACIAGAISVAATWDANVGPFACDATTAADKITCFSNRNSVTDIVAPGALITSTYLGGSAATLLGTSMAAPHVAGCAADLLEAVPGTTAAALEAALESTGAPILDAATSLTFPRVDCLSALSGLDPCRDEDGDTHPAGAACGPVPLDCDDTDPAVNPAATEVCNLVDDDCDASADEDVCTASCPAVVVTWDGSTSINLRAPSIRLRYGRGVYLIRGAELAASGFSSGAQLRAISWAYSVAPGLAGTGSLKVYLQNTTDSGNTKSTTWATAVAGMTEVYNASTQLPNITGPFGVAFPAGFTYTGGGLYVAFDWQYPVGAISTTVAVQTEGSLANGLLAAQSITSPPATLAAVGFRPATWLDKSVPSANLGVSSVRTLGALPVGLVAPQVVQAIVTNHGGLPVAGAPITLDITGAGGFSDTQSVSLAACSGQTLVSFAAFTPGTLGAGTAAVSAPADAVAIDDEASVPMDVTVNRYSYKHPGTAPSGGTGFSGSTGELVARFTTTDATQVDAVTVEFTGTGAPYRVVIRADSGSGLPGALLYQDAANRTVTAAGPVTVRLPAPVAVGPGSFFAGIAQTSTVNANLGFDLEVPIRPGTFYRSTTPATGPWTDFAPGHDSKLNVGVLLGPCLVPLTVDVVQDGVSSACAGAAILFTCNTSGGTGARTYQWTENGVDIPGATSPTYAPIQGSAGSFTYNCRVTDDGGCLDVQDASSATGTWSADGSACDDGNGCTAADTCGGGACSGIQIPSPGEVTGLGLQADRETLIWNPAADAAVYDVARGLVGQLPVGSGAAEVCLGSFVPATASDAAVPASGQAFWYLVRGRNTCATGSYGANRVTSVCP